ncbi:cryptochrome/photolyase family protein [Acinetobacter pragensis]|uniref:cryptochrome/photolyase family protein n=1 Tax=Acinetobacter pragensis TaxID=1806892 RepID=UPI003341504F
MQLIWYRQDLRISDHSALWHAAQAGPCIAIAFISPAQSKLHDESAAKNTFYLRQLNALKSQLNQLNIPLRIMHIPLWKDIPEALQTLCRQLKIHTVHANIEIGLNELQRDAQSQKCLERINIPLELYHDRTIFPIGSILNKSNQPYQVFSAFKKQCYELLSIALPQCFPEIKAQQPLPAETLSDLQHGNMGISQCIADASIQPLQKLWPVSEHYALEQLDQFIENHLYQYKEQRDFPNLDTTSQLSPYLNTGILSIRQCLQAMFRKQQGYFQIDNAGQQTWLDELLWREFYQHILFHYPAVSKRLPFESSTLTVQWRDAEHDLNAWQQGQTGIPIVDAGMRQLLHTGWMHNRVRMITAMFLCKNLLIDWRLGEKWFMQHLIDGDLAANNGGWQWCASTGTDAVPYFRIFNPVSQSQKFDPDGAYIRQWVPELADLDAARIHDPFSKFPDDRSLNYPRPIADLKHSRTRAIEAFKITTSL